MELLIYILAAASPFLIAGPIILLFRRSEAKRFHRHLTEVELSSLEHAGPGRAQVEGVVQSKETMRAPLSGEEVVGFRFQVETYGKHGWSSDREFHLACPFDVVGEGGSAAVDPADVELLLMEQTEEYVGFLDRLPQPTAERLRSVSQLKAVLDWRADGKFDRRYRLLEGRLVSGVKVVVDGHLERVTSAAGAARDYRQPPASLVFRAQGRMVPIVSDCARAELLQRLKRVGKNRRFIPGGLSRRITTPGGFARG